MKISFLIVTRHRPEELSFTLNKLKQLIQPELHEVLVFIDYCSDTEQIVSKFQWVKWYTSGVQLGASPARNQLYQHAAGEVWIGLDDDAHPLGTNFIKRVLSRFRESENTAIIAFQEVRGSFQNDQIAMNIAREGVAFPVSEFVGCGFAIRKDVYLKTNGFPLWMDIYGEESAVSLEVVDLGYDIIYDYCIMVNHRKDVVKRTLENKNYFRFEKQLVNVVKFYMVYYKQPTYLIFRALFHNFKKYAITDFNYLGRFLKAIFTIIVSLPDTLSHRNPIDDSSIKRFRSLKAPFYQ
ncbi:GT2 family glycosyltransferase [Nonlabens dokdonensis]|jgi:GT2 family glycosyltransferase|uniref:Glycosyl transferase, group 2 family protein n=2 Tax=Nonlabens dokdonensis TaxID=328515 RepID=L7WEW4_NONDD|nr:glycosyltransferase [Nonlabens dokdonensis]AGC77418.1 glycosyl transferase, group 2 family protein [Nonlabens dokdonensis DSW-6]PZX40944.1 GT2 family glycosyltransferase [Nonlabens dokdonensis]